MVVSQQNWSVVHVGNLLVIQSASAVMAECSCTKGSSVFTGAPPPAFDPTKDVPTVVGDKLNSYDTVFGVRSIDCQRWEPVRRYPMSSSEVSIFVGLLNGLARTLESDVLFLHVPDSAGDLVASLNWSAKRGSPNELKQLVSFA